MNGIVRALKSFIARREARSMGLRNRRLRRAVHDEHRKMMRLIEATDLRVRGLRLYAAWLRPEHHRCEGRIGRFEEHPMLPPYSGAHPAL